MVLKNIITLGLILVLFTQSTILKAQNTAILDSAMQYYTNNHFEKAITSYEQLLNDGYESAELYFNLGNAYYKSNKIPLAIVNYERAKKLNSSDEDIEFNLQLANTHVIDKIDVIPEFFLSAWWVRLINFFSSNQWGVISLLAFFTALIGFLVFFLSNRTILRQIGFWLGVLFLVSTIFTFSFSRRQYLVAQNEPEAIVFTPSVVVKSAPNNAGTDLFLIHEGLKVRVVKKSEQWCEIKLTDGNKGWIKQTDIVII